MLSALVLAMVIGVAVAFLVEGLRLGLVEASVALAGVPVWLLPMIGGAMVTLILLLPGRRQTSAGSAVGGLADLQAHFRGAEGSRSLGFGGGLKSFVVHGVALSCASASGILGPMVYLSGWCARLLSEPMTGVLSVPLRRHLIAGGAAAAVSAALNAPLAGIFFAFEVVLVRPRLLRAMPIMVASISAALISRHWFDDSHLLAGVGFEIAHWSEYPLLAMLGLVAGALAAQFSEALARLHDGIRRIPWLFAVRSFVAGCVLGLAALVIDVQPNIGGLEGVRGLMTWQGEPVEILLMLASLMVLLLVSLGGDYGTGVFAPSLLIGALQGLMFWHGAGVVLSADALSDPAVYALVGMAAYIAAILGAPWFAVVLAFEISLDYAATLAVMAASILAAEVMRTICGRSVFDRLRRQR